MESIFKYATFSLASLLVCLFLITVLLQFVILRQHIKVEKR